MTGSANHAADSGPSITSRLARHGPRHAVVDPVRMWTYTEIDTRARAIADLLLAGRADLGEARVALLCDPGGDFIAALFGIWYAGGIAVPLHPPHPVAEMEYLVDDADVEAIAVSITHRPRAEALRAQSGMAVVSIDGELPVSSGGRDNTAPDRGALMIHTSGTTGRPKGVVHTHASIAAQVDGMLTAWRWQADDRIVLVLPLNHVHGLVNVVLTALAAGATCEVPGGFDPVQVWERLASGAVTVFMAVPTIYARLVAAWEHADPSTQQRWSVGAARLRLMVSGSSALPVSTLARWRQLTGHTLLERYGMTELGMTLGNLYDHRVPGLVGVPFPGVEVRLVDDTGSAVSDDGPGELLVRGPNVFREYWRRPDATAEAFDDGWFRTGDIAQRTVDGYRILGRASVDIIKTGGEKVSALEIEEVYRTHPAIDDVAVVGLDDLEWGERVAAAVVRRPDHIVTGEELRAWGKGELAAAKVPSVFVFVDQLPRNSLGKVVKPDVKALF